MSNFLQKANLPVAVEVESMGDSEREVTREFLMFQGVRFAFRVHQFAGGSQE